MEEKWSKVVGVGEIGEGYYVSNKGNVITVKSGSPRKLHSFVTNVGYEYITLNRNNESKKFGVHVLVALAFIDAEGREKGLEVNHKDLNKTNNNVENLEWVTHSENQKHQYRNHHKDFKPNDNRCVVCGKKISATAKYCTDCKEIKNRKMTITREELKQELLCRNLEAIGKKYSVNGNSVRKRCLRLGLKCDSKTLKNTSDYGILHEQWNDLLEENLEKEKQQAINKIKNKERIAPKEVFMINKDTDEIIRKFNSIAEAGMFLEKKPVHIPDVCSGKRKSAYGYKWQYVN